jgi:membrane-bound serine protease (ClpP class)
VRRRRLALLVAFAALAQATLPALSQTGESGGRFAATLEITGAIGPATARHVKDGLALAQRRRAEVVILRLATPGGLASSMREIITDILASPVPVVGYVGPSGAQAASAGTYILYATHVAAMAPGTNIGAATPVQLGGLPGLPERGKDGDKKDGSDRPAPPADAMAAKATNDAAALIRSLAELRGRNADWGEQAVREAASLSANAALAKGAVDLVADSAADLLDRIDGREVQIAGKPHRLATRGLPVEVIERSWLARLLAVITDPNVAVILMLIGIYGLIFEFSSPGAVAPGVIGGICLVLGLYALNTLPVDYTGLALMLLGIGFLVAEAFTPTVVLGLGGLVAFILGAAMLIDTGAPEFRLSWGVIGGAAAASAGLFTFLLGSVWRSRRRPVRSGREAIIGAPVEVLDWSGETGHVLASGERWQARGPRALARGDSAQVTGVDGLTLVVRSGAAGTAGGGGES